MTYTYDSTDLSTDLAKVRSAIGDTDEHPHYSLTDEEINNHIDNAPSLAIAYYLASRARHAKAALWSTRNAANVNADRNSIVAALREVMDRLRDDAGGAAAVATYDNITVAAGMLSQDELDNAADDTDYPDPPFKVGQHDNPGAVAGDNELTNG